MLCGLGQKNQRIGEYSGAYVTFDKSKSGLLQIDKSGDTILNMLIIMQKMSNYILRRLTHAED